jgi:hypothetical protein
MSRAPCRWKQRDATRALRAARAAGIEARVDIAPDGKISIIPLIGPQEPPKKTNEWDDVLGKPMPPLHQ